MLSRQIFVSCPLLVAQKQPFYMEKLMQMTFHEMELRFGAVAHEYLREIEKAARIAPNPVLDPEIRLANAFQAQDAALEMGAA